MNIYWIDDTPDRETASEQLGQVIGYPIKFICVENIPVEPELEILYKKALPDLFILDHSLTANISKTVRTGSALAFMIRDYWPTCPIICVTAAGIEKPIDSRHRDVYELVIPDDEIGDYFAYIEAFIEGFRYLNSEDISSAEFLVGLLSPPVEEDIEKILKILPSQLMGDFGNNSIRLEYFKWVDHILFNRPGFLLDKLWTSTLIGLTEEGFDQVQETFEGAKYTGIFSNTNVERWWKSKVLEILSETTEKIGLPWHLGRYLIPGSPELYPKCAFSEEDYPDTVAYLEANKTSERHPVKTVYTEDHPLFPDMIFFEPILTMKAAGDED